MVKCYYAIDVAKIETSHASSVNVHLFLLVSAKNRDVKSFCLTRLVYTHISDCPGSTISVIILSVITCTFI